MTKTRTIIIFLIVFFGVLVFSKSSLANTYYVDNTCANNGNGLSQTCASSPGGTGPFNSRANAQSAVTGNQSDSSLLFKRGQTFSGQFTVGAYGTAGHPFTIGAYGTGANPIISGGGSCIYISSKNYVTVTDVTVGNATGQWGAGLYAISCDHVIFQNCTVNDESGAETHGIYIVNCTNSTVDSNIVTNPTGYHGIGILGGASHTGNTISNNTVYDIRVTGIFTSGGNGNRLTGQHIFNNESYNCKAGMYLNWTDNSEIYNNHIHDNKKTDPTGEPYGIGVMSCSNNDFYFNRIHDNNNKGIQICGEDTNGASDGNLFHHNWVYNHTQELNEWGGGIAMGASAFAGGNMDNNKVYYNIVSNNLKGIIIDQSSNSTGETYYNNTIYGNGRGMTINSDAVDANPHVAIENNIFSKNTSYDIDANNSTANLTHNNNLYFHSTAANVRVRYNSTSYNLTTVKSAFETSCQNTDPKLVSTSDFHLLSDSPSINTGVDVGLTQDYEGNPIIGLPDIGAYEYVSSTTDTTPPASPSGVTII